MSTTANSTTIDTTEIRYDRTTKDYAILDNGRVIGYASTYSQAEQKRTAYLVDRAFDAATARGWR